MGNNGGSSSGGEVFAGRRLAAPGFIDGVQDVVVQVRSFSLRRKNNSLASHRLPVVAGSHRLSQRKITREKQDAVGSRSGHKEQALPCI